MTINSSSAGHGGRQGYLLKDVSLTNSRVPSALLRTGERWCILRSQTPAKQPGSDSMRFSQHRHARTSDRARSPDSPPDRSWLQQREIADGLTLPKNGEELHFEHSFKDGRERPDTDCAESTRSRVFVIEYSQWEIASGTGKCATAELLLLASGLTLSRKSLTWTRAYSCLCAKTRQWSMR